MKVPTFDTKGNKAAETTLKDEVFAVPTKVELLVQYLRTAVFNKRQGTVSTKTRGEVSGSGAKPWSQKGTGRARVGEKRNPIWTKGGISHGPKPKSWRLNINKKARSLVLSMVLSDKAKNGNLLVIEDLGSLKGKTKEALELINKLNLGAKPLFMVEKLTPEIRKSIRNINKAAISTAGIANAHDIFAANKVLMTKKAAEVLEKKLGGGK